MQDKPKNQNAPKLAVLFIETLRKPLLEQLLKCATQRLPGFERLMATKKYQAVASMAAGGITGRSVPGVSGKSS